MRLCTGLTAVATACIATAAVAQPANDDCANATAVAGPYPVQISGDNEFATVDCVGVLDWSAQWFAIDLPYASNDLYLDYCPGAEDIYNVGIVIYDTCPTDTTSCEAYIIADSYSFVTCGPGSMPQMYWLSLPGPGTAYLPVNVETELGDLLSFVIDVDVQDHNAVTGACCVGVACQATNTETECTALGGTWYIGETCPEFNCAIPPNDNCEDLTPFDMVKCFKYQESGTTAGATVGSCGSYGGNPLVWHAFEITEVLNVTIDYCDTPVDLNSVYPYLNGSCPCGNFLQATTTDWGACDMGPVMTWENLAVGVWYYPVVNIDGIGPAGPYVINLRGVVDGEPCPGSCCIGFTNPECNDLLSEEDCLAFGGIWYGDEPSCTTFTCPEPCIIECPVGALTELEACGADTNGGCNADPVAYETLACGETICGESFADGGTRDTDWFEVTITEPSTITWTVYAEFPANIIVMEASDCANIITLATGETDDCLVPAVATTECVPAGTYVVFVAPQLFEGTLCTPQPQLNHWYGTVTCTPGCTVPTYACCHGQDNQTCSNLSFWDCRALGGRDYPGEDCGTFTCPPAPLTECPTAPVVLFQNTDPAEADAGVSCGAGADYNTENWYCRGYDLATELPGDTLYVSCVEVGSGGPLPIGRVDLPAAISIYADGTGAPPTIADLTLLGTSTGFEIPENSAEGLLAYTFDPPIEVPAGTFMVVELYVASSDGLGGGRWFPGGNELGQSGPTYLYAPSCAGLDLDYVDAATLGFAWAWQQYVHGSTEGGNTCPWDFDLSGTVGIGDLNALLSNWGQPCPGAGCPFDYDESGSVGLGDLNAMLSNWGPCP